MPRPEPSDATLAERARTGDREAFGLLHRRYRRAVREVCAQRVGDPAEVEDAIQRTFELVLVRLPQLERVDRIGAYITQTAHYVCADRVRARVHANEWPAGDARMGDGPDHTADDEMQAVTDRMATDELLAALTPVQAEMLDAHHRRGEPLREVAHRLGSTPGSIAVRLHRARAAARAVAERLDIRGLVAPLTAARLRMADDRHGMLQVLTTPGVAFSLAGVVALAPIAVDAVTRSGPGPTTAAVRHTPAVAPSPTFRAAATAPRRRPPVTTDPAAGAVEATGHAPEDAGSRDDWMDLPPVSVPVVNRQVTHQQPPDDPDYTVEVGTGDTSSRVVMYDEPELEPAVEAACDPADAVPNASCTRGRSATD